MTQSSTPWAEQLITIDANSDFKNSFTKLHSKGMILKPSNTLANLLDAVYLSGSDALLGPLLAIVYRENPDSPTLSTILIGRHGVSESVNMTISPKSRFYGACLNLPQDQRSSMVRKAVAIACLRTFSNLELALKSYLTFYLPENQLFDWDETTAGTVASQMVPATGNFPSDIGNVVIDSGALHPKFIKSAVIDIIYQDSQATNDLNNELVYLFGHQLEHLFDPLAEYSPEPTEMLYTPPSYPPMRRPSDNQTVLNVCEELFSVQSNFTTDLLNLLQDYLIPLRVNVLGGEMPGVNMRKLNMIFPPTIDEIVRVNNILYEALDQALPYGSYEVVKACGISIPYFYKACMRHEAATRNFSSNLRDNIEIIKVRGPSRFTINRIESIIHCSLHLTKIKMVLDRLVKIVHWREAELGNVDEFYQSAVGTIDSFGRESFISPYDNRIFTHTGKLLVEISKGWPKELEYGWINRRVVTIFDAVDVMGQKEIFSVVFIFTDSIVVIKPSEAVGIVSDSGFHKPSIADMLMHSMINSVPLPKLPELTVVGWAPIEDVFMAEYGGPQNLAMYVTGAGFCTGNTASHLQLYKLIRPEASASAIVNYISKAKIMNKTQPFHLFLNQQLEFSTFGTVQEYQGYRNEARKSPIAVFANMTIPENVLDKHDLIACIGTRAYGHNHIAISVISKLAYKYEDVVSKGDFSGIISSQVARIYSLYFASSNPFATEMIIQNNTALANYLIGYATTRNNVRKKSHRSRKVPARVTIEAPTDTPSLKRQPSLLQRLSPVFSKISHRVSTDFLRKGDSKKRKLKFIGRSPQETETKASNRYSVISLPVQKVTAQLSATSIRHSYPSNAPTSAVLTSSPKDHLTPSFLQPARLSPSQQELVVQRKTSFSIAQTSTLQSRYVRNMPSQDMVSLASSQYSHAVKDTERFSDSHDDYNSLHVRHSMPPESYMETIQSDSGSSIQNSTTLRKLNNKQTSMADSVHEDAASLQGTSHSRSFVTVSNFSLDSLAHSPGSSAHERASLGSSVENWYQDLNNRRDESLDSLDSHVPPDDGNDTTFDDDDVEAELTTSMKNLTMFIDGGREDRPALPLSSNPNSENSILLADDFAYLTGMMDDTDSPSHVKPGLYPDIRESSLIYMGNFIHTHDGSDLQSKPLLNESLGMTRQQQELSQQSLCIPPKPNFISEHEWMGFSDFSSGGIPSHSSHVDALGHYYGDQVADEPDSRYTTDNMVVYSYSSSNVSERSDDVGSILWLGNQGQRQGFPGSRVLSMSHLSSAEIGLRSLTFNIGSLIQEERTGAAGPSSRTASQALRRRSSIVNDLERINFTVMRLYEGTKSLISMPPSIKQLDQPDQVRVVRVERANRQLLMSCLWALINAQQFATDNGEYERSDRYMSVVQSFLDLEWQRRTKMHEKMGRAMPVRMWSV